MLETYRRESRLDTCRVKVSSTFYFLINQNDQSITNRITNPFRALASARGSVRLSAESRSSTIKLAWIHAFPDRTRPRMPSRRIRSLAPKVTVAFRLGDSTFMRSHDFLRLTIAPLILLRMRRDHVITIVCCCTSALGMLHAEYLRPV